MKIIETGMTVRLLTDDITGTTKQVRGMIGRVTEKETDYAGVPMFWVSTPRKRTDGFEIGDRAPYYAEDLEVVSGGN